MSYQLFSSSLSWQAHVAGSPPQEGEHVQTVESGQAQKHFIEMLPVVNVFYVIHPKQVVRNEADHHDEGKAQTLQLSPKVLLRDASLVVRPVQNPQDIGLEGCQHCSHHNDYCAYDVVDGPGTSIYATAKLKALLVFRGSIVDAFAVGKREDARDRDEHNYPHHRADKESVNSPEGGLPLSFVVER